MANIIKLGSILLDGLHTKPGSKYQPGQTIDFGNGDSLQWIVVNDMLIADRPLLTNISWNDLNQQNLVLGKEVIINSQLFHCRLLKVGVEKGVSNEWDDALDIIGESNDLWNWKDAFCWGHETPAEHASHRVGRGCHSVRYWSWSPTNFRSERVGFSPALVSLPSDNLVAGDTVCAIGSQTILYGKLVDLTRYDAIIQPEATSMMAEADAGKCYSKLPDGMVVLDRTHMAIQTIKGK